MVFDYSKKAPEMANPRDWAAVGCGRDSHQDKIANGYLPRKRLFILNRVRARSRYGNTIEYVCRYPAQFSCWNPGDINRPMMEKLDFEKDDLFRSCLAITAAVIFGLVKDPTSGATHFHVKDMDPKPFWAKNEPVAKIGNHLFFKGVL